MGKTLNSNNMKNPKHIKINSKVWDVVDVMNVTPAGSVGEDELAYVISGWGDDDGVTQIVLEHELNNMISDGLAVTLD
jgi:hypothetical protein